ncbi:MAG: hypothetical protein WAU25_07050, partial [Nitrososphaeraceae archaeon]
CLFYAGSKISQCTLSVISRSYHRKLKKLTRRIIPNESVKNKKPNKNDYDRTPLPKFTFG